MSSPFTDDLLLLPEELAVQRQFDARNLRVARFLWWVFLVVLLVYAIELLTSAAWVLGSLAVANLVGLGVLLRRLRPPPARATRQIVVGYLGAQMAVLLVLHRGDVESFQGWVFAFPLLLPFLRLRGREVLALVGVVLALMLVSLGFASLVSEGLGSLPGLLTDGSVIGFLGEAGLFAAFGALAARRSRRTFLAWWGAEVERHRERLRMKAELESAREIQLSMLPRGVPSLSWLDLASVSLPASEVGGDYYDYFHLDGGRLAVVVADVAGHGAPSGMVLSGVRAGLNLLEERMDEPVWVLEQLHRMVRRTSSRRMFVSLLLAVLDPRRATLRLASAGHPPLLRRAGGSRTVEEHLLPAAPLGALSGIGYPERELSLGPGDILLLYTDGVVEQLDAEGQAYGFERLSAQLAAAPTDATAAMVRDALLQDLWDFKGTEPQVDDVTLVVARRTDGAPAAVPSRPEGPHA